VSRPGLLGVLGEDQQLVGERSRASRIEAQDRVGEAGRLAVAIVGEHELDLLAIAAVGQPQPAEWVYVTVAVLAHRPNRSQLRVEACSERSSAVRVGSAITVAVCWWARMLARSPSAKRP
jgi:hypothetical protein